MIYKPKYEQILNLVSTDANSLISKIAISVENPNTIYMCDDRTGLLFSVKRNINNHNLKFSQGNTIDFGKFVDSELFSLDIGIKSNNGNVYAFDSTIYVTFTNGSIGYYDVFKDKYTLINIPSGEGRNFLTADGRKLYSYAEPYNETTGHYKSILYVNDLNSIPIFATNFITILTYPSKLIKRSNATTLKNINNAGYFMDYSNLVSVNYLSSPNTIGYDVGFTLGVSTHSLLYSNDYSKIYILYTKTVFNFFPVYLRIFDLSTQKFSDESILYLPDYKNDPYLKIVLSHACLDASTGNILALCNREQDESIGDGKSVDLPIVVSFNPQNNNHIDYIHYVPIGSIRDISTDKDGFVYLTGSTIIDEMFIGTYLYVYQQET